MHWQTPLPETFSRQINTLLTLLYPPHFCSCETFSVTFFTGSSTLTIVYNSKLHSNAANPLFTLLSYCHTTFHHLPLHFIYSFSSLQREETIFPFYYLKPFSSSNFPVSQHLTIRFQRAGIYFYSTLYSHLLEQHLTHSKYSLNIC